MKKKLSAILSLILCLALMVGVGVFSQLEVSADGDINFIELCPNMQIQLDFKESDIHADRYEDISKTMYYYETENKDFRWSHTFAYPSKYYVSIDTIGKYRLEYKNDSTGETKSFNINIRPHTLAEVKAKAATCYEEGNIKYYKCSRCENCFSDEKGTERIYTDSIVIPKAHQWDAGVVTKEATTDKDGEIVYTCKVCGEKLTEAISYREGFVKDKDNVIRYYEKNKVATGLTDVKYDPVSKNWYNVVKGVVTSGPTVAHNAAGWWYIDKDGKVDFKYNGFANNAAGEWYCKGGLVDFKTTEVVYDQVSKNWYYVRGNKLTPGPDIQPNAAGWWYVDKTGKVDFKKNGVEHNAAGWWYVNGGKVDFSYTGVQPNSAGWWRIESGKVNFNFTGIASNAAGSWYLKGGKVDFNKNGKVNYNGVTYNVKGGKVQTSTNGSGSGNSGTPDNPHIRTGPIADRYY